MNIKYLLNTGCYILKSCFIVRHVRKRFIINWPSSIVWDGKEMKWTVIAHSLMQLWCLKPYSIHERKLLDLPSSTFFNIFAHCFYPFYLNLLATCKHLLRELMKQSRLTVREEWDLEKIHLLNCIVNGKRSLICETSPKNNKARLPTTNFTNFFSLKINYWKVEAKTVVNLWELAMRQSS